MPYRFIKGILKQPFSLLNEERLVLVGDGFGNGGFGQMAKETLRCHSAALSSGHYAALSFIVRGRSQRTEGRRQKKGVFKIGVLERSFAVLAVAVGGHGEAEGMGPEMGHAAEKIYGLFRVSLL